MKNKIKLTVQAHCNKFLLKCGSYSIATVNENGNHNSFQHGEINLPINKPRYLLLGSF